MDEENNGKNYNFKVQNIVASTQIADQLDLYKIEKEFEGAEYDKIKFPGLVYRRNNPKAAFLVFSTGKMVCTGARDVNDINYVVSDMADNLTKLGMNIYENYNVNIQNIVASADLERQLNLNAIAIALGLEKIEYEPEQFPGLVYRVDDPNVVMLLFRSGKIVITGGNTLEECEKGVNVVHEQLEDIGLI